MSHSAATVIVAAVRRLTRCALFLLRWYSSIRCRNAHRFRIARSCFVEVLLIDIRSAAAVDLVRRSKVGRRASTAEAVRQALDGNHSKAKAVTHPVPVRPSTEPLGVLVADPARPNFGTKMGALMALCTFAGAALLVLATGSDAMGGIGELVAL